MWPPDNARLNHYYKSELDFLRRKAQDFSDDHPSTAEYLKLSKGKSHDPHIEMLLQSFAFLTGRLNYRLDAESPEISSQLLTNLYPHLAAPVPSMAVVEAQVIPDGANFSNGYALKRGRLLTAQASKKLQSGANGVCTSQVCFDTDLWPLKISHINKEPTNSHDFLSVEHANTNVFSKVKSVLKIRVENTGNDPISDFSLRELRFFINGDEVQTSALYEILTCCVLGVTLINDSGQNYHLSQASFQTQGFSDEQAALPYTQATHQGYRLLQEYFAFPEKFLFIDLLGLDKVKANKHFDILLLLNKPIEPNLNLSSSVLKLNCLPVVNLFQRTTDPIRLDKQQSEYRLIPDIANYKYCEIHSIEQVIAINTSGRKKAISPQFSLQTDSESGFYQGFWSMRREVSHVKSLPGTEVFLSFFDPNEDPKSPAEDSVYAKSLCCNRELMEQMRIGSHFDLDGGGPISGVTMITKPSRHQTPKPQGITPWKLISQLTLNQLSLSDNQEALNNLKQILILHAGEFSRLNQNQVDSIFDVKLKRAVQHIGDDAWRGFCEGMEIILTLDDDVFQGRSCYLFCEVLRRFFALYASVNSFTQLSLEFKKQKRGVVKQWQALAGEQALI